MTALAFPAAPSSGQLFTDGTRWWQWDTIAWRAFSLVGWGGKITSIDCGGPTTTDAKIIASLTEPQLPASLGRNIYTDEQVLNNNRIRGAKTLTFEKEIILTATTGTITIDWSAGQHYVQPEPTGTITYVFIDPPGPCHCELRIESDGVNAVQTINFPANVIQYGFTFAMTANKKHMVNLKFASDKNYHLGSMAQV